MEIRGVSAISVVVREFEAARDFYERYLNLSAVPDKPQRYRASDSGPEIQLIEVPEARLDPEDPRYAGHHFHHFGFEVQSLDDMIARSIAHGVRVFQIDATGQETEISRPGQDLSAMPEAVLFVRDRDNNLWEFAERGRSTAILFET
jgi:catechol 2,3-dioxygenase-like lactoylglutathione lyase family enzyme